MMVKLGNYFSARCFRLDWLTTVDKIANDNKGEKIAMPRRTWMVPMLDKMLDELVGDRHRAILAQRHRSSTAFDAARIAFIAQMDRAGSLIP